MSAPPAALELVLADLRRELGPPGVLVDAAEVAGYTTDWTGAFAGRAAAVLRPSTTAEVAACVRRCHGAGIALVPQGGNTGLVGGGVPDDTGAQLVLSTTRMRRVREVDPVADTMTVEAGVLLATAQQAADGVDRLFPLSLGSEGSCTIGGNVSTNAGGTAVLRYGMMRDLVLGLEVVLPDGRVWDGLRTVRKDNTGYDLKQLFIGAEGTLGVVTAAVLRLFPATPRRATAWLALPSAAAGVEVLGLLRRHAGAHLTTWELVSRTAVELVLAAVPGARDPFAEPHPWYGLVELAAPEGERGLDEVLERTLAPAVATGLARDVAVAGGPAQRRALWLLREGISEAQKPAGAGLKHDVTLPIGALADFVDVVGPRVQEVVPGVRLVTYGHVGDGNLHYNLSRPVDGTDAEFLARRAELSGIVHDEVATRGGSISAEHGLGVLKRDAAASYKPEVEVDLMRTLRRALDPEGLMNPGKVTPPG